MTVTIRLVVSDVDGTLVTDDKSLLPSTIAATGRLRDAGIPLAIISSRPPRGMDSIRDTLGLTGPIGAFNGGIVAQGETIIAQHLVPEDAARRAIDFFAQHGIAAWLFADDKWLLKDRAGDYVPLERRTIGFDATVVDDFAPHLARCGKIVGVSKDFERLAACVPQLNAMLGDHARAQLSQKYYIDVTHRDANKGAALRSIADWYGVDPAVVAAIGDMTNDVPMFNVAGLGIAMGNAPPTVAAMAKLQTGPNTGTGWADAMDRYILSHN